MNGARLMLSDSAFSVARRLRQSIGADKKGIGPDTRQLIELFSDLEPAELRAALDELSRIAFITLDTRMAVPVDGIPEVFSDIAGITVQEPMQVFLDKFED